MSLESHFDALLNRIASNEQDALSLLESLLRFCRAHMSSVVKATRDGGHHQLRTDADRAFVSRLDQPDAKHALVLPLQATSDIAAVCSGLIGRAQIHRRDEVRCIAIRSLAEAIDRSHHARIRVAWTNRGVRDLKPNELVPIFSPFQQRAFRRAYGGVGTPPHKLDRSVDMTEHAVLVPEQIPHAAKLMAQPGWDGLDRISVSSRVACALLTSEDLVISEKDLGQSRFFGAAPPDAEEALKRAMRLVKEADGDGTHVVLLPELSLDSAGVFKVAQWVKDHAEHIALAVCGTHHPRDEGPRRNEAVLASSISPMLKQCKIVGFDLKLTSGTQELREDIEANDTPLLLITAQTWSALVLICRDFIDAQLSELARKLRVSLILVPACSPRTADFRWGAGELASKAQAHVLVANHCSDTPDNPDCAVLTRPSRDRGIGEIVLAAKGLALPRRATAILHQGNWMLDD